MFRWLQCKCPIKFQIPFGWFSNHFFLTVFSNAIGCLLGKGSMPFACTTGFPLSCVRALYYGFCHFYFHPSLWLWIGWKRSGQNMACQAWLEGFGHRIQYFSVSTRVLSRQYWSTLGAVLEYFYRSTGVFLLEYSSIPTGVFEYFYRSVLHIPCLEFWKLRDFFAGVKGECRKPEMDKV